MADLCIYAPAASFGCDSVLPDWRTVDAVVAIVRLYCAAILCGYIVMPILDWLIGSDTNNPPEEIMPQLDADLCYRWLTYATVPLHFVVLIIMCYVVASHPLSLWVIFACAIVAGGYSGLGINTAHELGHKNTSIEKPLDKID